MVQANIFAFNTLTATLVKPATVSPVTPRWSLVTRTPQLFTIAKIL